MIQKSTQPIKKKCYIFPVVAFLMLYEHLLDIFWCLVSLVVNIFIFCAMDGNKCASEVKSEPYRKCTAVDLER
jgi:hypothetical protein